MSYDFSDVYAGLKDFQHATVDHAFRRMYLDDDPARRFLVADEVGLGKTLVARGLIARAIEHLDEQGIDRIDVVYICSNSDIAKQNINRLNVTGRRDFAFASRITLLAAQLQDLTRNPLNFVSFTPGTSFDLKSNLGVQEERMLLYWLIKKAWPDSVGTKKGPKRLFQGGVLSFDSWSLRLKEYQQTARKVDRKLRDRYLRALADHDRECSTRGEATLRGRFDELASAFAFDRRNRDPEQFKARNRLIGELRAILARTTIEALEPDLVILDEFQRFKQLLDGDTPAAQLAHSMFNFADENAEARVLLLSATPYKMYTISDESAEDDHYADFLRTVQFLTDDDADDFRSDLRGLRTELFDMNGDHSRLLEAKGRVEHSLRKIMARTERLAVTPERDGMLVEMVDHAPVAPSDLVSAVNLQRASDELEAGGTVEYWKSTPFFATFWQDYKAGKRYSEATIDEPERAERVRRLLTPGRELLPFDKYETYAEFDIGNGRMRSLIDQTIETGAWKRLWLAPALPYYELNAPFDEPAARTDTKRLVFSAWNVVPRAVSGLLSYEADRRMMTMRPGKHTANTTEARERFTEPLRFPKTRSGMSALALVYPSPSLARYGDPLEHARGIATQGAPVTAESVTRSVADELMRRLRPHFPAEGPVDDRWYWAAALVLDRDMPDQHAWIKRRRLADVWSGGQSRGTGGLDAHLDLARQADRGDLELGLPPDDLGEVLALLAVGGPGNIALRSLGRITRRRRSEYSDVEHRDAAARMAWGFRSLFNNPETVALIRALYWGNKSPYWQKALRYGVDGCLQSVLDEYVHVLREWLGILNTESEGALDEIARTIADVVSLRAADIRARDPHAEADEADRRLRSRFALAFTKHRSEEEKETRRSGYVRAAFNSPFWPFVLTTTSIGQEGLDFHLYCHAVVHWNLPANPVDLEQREGRVHRYMGHAVRKNLAAVHGTTAVQEDVRNPWASILDAAIADRPAGVSDLVPFWVFDGDASIERHVPVYPLSREIPRLAALHRSLAVYRMVFGQPRQEELLEWLEQRPDREELIDLLRVDLTPR